MRLSRSLRAVAAPEATEGVTTLELFFDLVFVFTITQVTSVVRQSHRRRAAICGRWRSWS